MEAVCEI